MSRENRVDKMVFIKKEEAISYAKKLNLVRHNLYISPEGAYKIKKYTKVNGEKVIGKFISTVSNGFTYYDYSEPVIKKASNGTRTKKFKTIDGAKLMNYIVDNGLDKRYLCDLLHRSRNFINETIKHNTIDILCLEKLCEHFEVPADYFDVVEKHPEPEPVVEEVKDDEVVQEFHCDQIHDDLIALIASNRRLEVLMQGMIDMWKND